MDRSAFLFRALPARLFFASLAAVAVLPVIAADTIDVAPYSAPDSFGDVVISPDGRYVAVTKVQSDRTGVAILERESQKPVAHRAMGPDTHVTGVTWVSNDRIMFSLAQAFGSADTPYATGELFSMAVDDGKDVLLIGARHRGNALALGGSKDNQSVSAFLVDDLPENDDEVLVAVVPHADGPATTIERMHVRTGRRVVVGRAPIARAGLATDHAHRVRFAVASGDDNLSRLYHRANDEAEWTLVNDEAKSGVVETPIGFSKGDRIAWLQVEQKSGPDAIFAFDTATGERKEVLRHGVVDPALILGSIGADPAPVGALYSGAGFDYGFFDPASEDAQRYKMLMSAFPKQAPYVTSTTADGRLAVVRVAGVHNPGEFYLFDTQSKQASFLLRRREGVPKDLAEVRPITVRARDGMVLHGFLTLPAGSDGKGLPLVVHPHGGPFGVHDALGFDPHVQLMAKAGYAVLQINHRGSSNYGRSYYHAGALQWGRKLQDDLTDATQWAIADGIADAGRICIYGASYGGYAAVYGVATQPDLYKCAIGYVGVYDLADLAKQRPGRSEAQNLWRRQWIGPTSEVAALSPIGMADRIKAPVLLASGGKDFIAPPEHTERMEKALRAAGVPVETLHFASEGHGFYDLEHRRAFDAKLLDFLARHIGGAAPAPLAAGGDDRAAR